MTGPTWFTVAVHTTEAHAELVSDLLWGFGPPAVEQRSGPEGFLVVTGFEGRARADEAAAAVAASGLGAARVTPVTDHGLDGWRAWARVERAGPFLLIPTWLPAPEPAPDDVVLHLDPGPTFGSGSHPTTRLVLAELARFVTAGSAVLDVGCGSGVLAVGAARLGATRVEAIDIDPASPEVTAANAERNGVADVVAATNRPLADIARGVRAAAHSHSHSHSHEAAYDLVAANLLAPVIVELAADLVAVVRAGGHLVVSGLLADRWQDAVADLVGPAGLEVEHVAEDDGWVAVTLRAGP